MGALLLAVAKSIYYCACVAAKKEKKRRKSFVAYVAVSLKLVLYYACGAASWKFLYCACGVASL